jgi:hypothetical protein
LSVQSLEAPDWEIDFGRVHRAEILYTNSLENLPRLSCLYKA